jgi:hypothetical protein
MTPNPHAAYMTAAPYPGLRPFKHTEADIFFGREEQADQLLKKLQNKRFLAVVGPSGCGKSSLVRAGMIPALEAGFLVDAGARWRIAEMRPGEHPLARLAEALASPRALGAERGEGAEAAAFLKATLRRGPLGLVEVLGETPLPEQVNLLLLVDQFEEIFRFREEGDSEEADAFVSLLLATAAQAELPVYVVITMRSDYLGDCALFTGLPEALNESQFLTPRLAREQSEAAIVKPARVFGGRVEPALVNRLLNDMGAAPDQLPLLQHCLMRMWTRGGERPTAEEVEGAASEEASVITTKDYSAVGGLEKALSNHANEVLGNLSERQQYIAQVMFRRLTQRGAGRRDTRRPARLYDIARVAGASPEEVAEVAEEFRRRDRSFVTPPPDTPLTPDTVLDISHESLIKLWDKLNEWVSDEARAAAFYERLRQTAALWPADADLWGGVNLERGLEWKEGQRREEQGKEELKTVGQKPTLEWALRYGTGDEYAQAMTFLDVSEINWEEKQRAEAEALKRERKADIERQAAKRFKLLSGALALIVVFAAVAAATAFQQRRVAEQQTLIAEAESYVATKQTRLAEASAAEAQTQKTIAATQKELAEAAAKDAKAKEKLAEQNSELAKKNEERAKEEAIEAARQKVIAVQALRDVQIEKGKTDKALADLTVEKGKTDKALADLQTETKKTEAALAGLTEEKQKTEDALKAVSQKNEALENTLASLREEQRLTAVLIKALKDGKGGDTPVNNQKTTGVKLQVTNVNGDAVRGPVKLILTDRVENKRMAALDYDPSNPRTLLIEGIPSGASRVYQIEVSGPAYRPVSKFVNIKWGEENKFDFMLPVNPEKVVGVEFPPFSKLPEEARKILSNSGNVISFAGKYGEELYIALDEIRRAGLLNILAKSRATRLDNDDNVLTFVEEIIEIRGDRFIARVKKQLMDEVKDAVRDGDFNEVTGALYTPPGGFKNAGSFRTKDRYGNLQITFFAKGDEYIADIDIDEASGLEHLFQTLRSKMTGYPTHPFDIQQILLNQKIDPDYKLLVEAGGTTPPRN